MEKYTGYATRSENTRNPDRMSQGNVARKRYKSVDHCGAVATLGQAGITGNQKRNPAPKNDACSMECHASECIPNVNNAGTCHPMRVDTETIQHNAGRESARTNRCANGRRNIWSRNTCPNRGKPYQNTSMGSHSKISAGAKVISKRCWIMWAVSKS